MSKTSGPAFSEPMDTAVIYALVDAHCSDPIERYRYVGQTRVHPDARLRRHWITAMSGAKEHRAAWMRAMQRNEREVAIEVLDLVPFYEADDAEMRHIRRFRAIGCDLTNRTDGGRGRRGWVVSEETRERMRVASSRRRASSETRRKMSESIRASEKHRAHLKRLHEANRRPCALETRQKISVANRGESNPHAVLTWQSADEIRQRYATGERQAHLARAFGCSTVTIHNVVTGKTWIRA
jgi:hypothetical protein